MKKRRFSHLQIIALGYFIMIAAGTLLLMLPVSTREPGAADLLSSAFTATSASCVTGLVVHDTGSYWSLFGQLVILCLIQLGGLGFMTVITFFLTFAGKKTGLRERAVMAESINTTRLSGFSSLIRKIVVGTAGFELTGAVLLAIRFIPRFGLRRGIYYSVFHAVSAFCNAGFDLMGSTEPYSSFCAFSDDILVNAVIMLLIVIGGLGFLVWDDLLACGLHFKKYKLHTKLVLVTSAILIFGGALLFYLFELDGLERDMPLRERILTSFFSSVTARTAGFNTVDTAALSPGSKLLTMLLMFIGGSSGSTAGGVKTTSIAVVLLYLSSAMRGREHIHCFGRRMEDSALKKAVVVIAINFSLMLAGSCVLCAVQDCSLTDICFETFSAIGTVGMTTGITRELHAVSRLVILFLMYCGRVGSISFALALFDRKVKPAISYPAEDITVG